MEKFLLTKANRFVRRRRRFFSSTVHQRSSGARSSNRGGDVTLISQDVTLIPNWFWPSGDPMAASCSGRRITDPQNTQLSSVVGNYRPRRGLTDLYLYTRHACFFAYCETFNPSRTQIETSKRDSLSIDLQRGRIPICTHESQSISR